MEPRHSPAIKDLDTEKELAGTLELISCGLGRDQVGRSLHVVYLILFKRPATSIRRYLGACAMERARHEGLMPASHALQLMSDVLGTSWRVRSLILDEADEQIRGIGVFQLGAHHHDQ